MKHAFRTLLLASVTTLVINGATAQTSDVEARIAALEAMVADLKAELEREKSDMDAELVRLQEAERTAPIGPAGAPVDGFMMGNTRVKIGGVVDVDTHVTQFSDGAVAGGSVVRDFYIPGATPIGGEEAMVTDVTAEATRLFFDAFREVDGEQLQAHIELDFLLSGQGNERVSNSFSPRLRRAYLDYKGWRIGQEWTTFQNTSAIPESASFLILSDGMVFGRQAMIRYTTGNWQFAIENGNTTVTPVGGGRIEADGNLIPDVIGRYNMKGDFGNVSFAAIGRQLRLETGVVDEETYGFGLSASGRIKVGEKDDIRFNLVGGEGLGRYVGLNAFNAVAIDPATGELEAIPSFGGLIAYRHPFGETARFSVGYSGLFADNPDFLGTGAVDSVQSVYGAVLWDVAPKVTVGTELMHGIRELESGADGSITRFTFSTKYAF